MPSPAATEEHQIARPGIHLDVVHRVEKGIVATGICPGCVVLGIVVVEQVIDRKRATDLSTLQHNEIAPMICDTRRGEQMRHGAIAD